MTMNIVKQIYFHKRDPTYSILVLENRRLLLDFISTVCEILESSSQTQRDLSGDPY